MKKIVIIGPESTGKSTICRQLADHFQTLWCPEYAREYLLQHGTQYTYAQLLEIAKGQIAKEEEYIRKAEAAGHSYLFIDTDLYVMKVWCEYVFNDCHAWILNQIAKRHYDGYLLCKNDLPWTKDELREYPDEGPRQQLFHIYHDLLVQQHVPWKLVRGTQEERLQTAVEGVLEFNV